MQPATCIGSGYNIADNVTGVTPGALGCQIADSANQDFLNTNPLTVNAEQFFGFTDWVFGGKLEDGPTSDPNPLQVAGTGEGQSGSWSVNLPNALSQYSNIMMIFKSGNGTRLVGYLLNATSGTWTSPFEEPPFNFPGNGPRDVSHISFYYRGEGTPIPTPALLPGLIGIGLTALRKRKGETTEAISEQ